MALWVWRFVEREPPHFFRAPPAFIIIYVACGGKVCEVFGGKKG